MLQPSIEVSGIIIDEPVTMLTDLLVSLVCFISYFKLSQRKSKADHFLYYKGFVLVMALATLYGGIIGHGFLYLFGFAWKIPGWIIGMLSIGLAERGAILHARKLLRISLGNFFSYANIFEVLLMIFIAVYTLNFFFVELHATYGLLGVVFSFELFIYVRTKRRGSRIILWAIAVSALSALVHLCKISPHTWFNYLDLSHVLMAFSFIVFHRGVTALYDNEDASH
jgi:hypothetical protein